MVTAGLVAMEEMAVSGKPVIAPVILYISQVPMEDMENLVNQVMAEMQPTGDNQVPFGTCQIKLHPLLR